MEVSVGHNRIPWINDRRMALLKKFLLLFFPLFLVFSAELNQMHSLGQLMHFLVEFPGVFLFDLIFTMLLYGLLLACVRYAGIAMAVLGMVYYIISWVEYFKYRISGSHFVLSDLVMTSNAFEVVQFAQLKITLLLVMNFLLLLVYCTAAFLLRLKVQANYRHSLIRGGCCATVLAAFFFLQPVHNAVFAAAGIDRKEINNAFEANEKFKTNNLVAFWVQSLVEKQNKQVTEPDDYSVYAIQALLDESKDQVSPAMGQPNVVVVMSESYGDFRKFDQLPVPDNVYQNFDRIAQEGLTGTAVMPTFGGYTAKSEFELLFGLPVRGLNTPDIPHGLLDLSQEQETFARYYDALGYHTVYLHPFDRYFYNRSSAYTTYGFDEMLFDEQLDAKNHKFRKYADDKLVYDTIQKQIIDSSEPVFAFATTMQNHSPYFDDPEVDSEFTYYLENIAHSDEAYGAFIDNLRTIDEPVVVLFVGDHFPFFSTRDNVYEKIGISSENCDVIYEQQYLIWSNRELESAVVDRNPKVSAYYLPYLIVQTAGLPKNDFIETMIDHMDQTPIYSPSYCQSAQEDAVLDKLTYDRTLGEQYTADTP